jgi:hypothetical protein
MVIVRGAPTPWNDWYGTARWQRLRRLQLRQQPLFKFCLERGIVTAANSVDHVTPHRGNWNAFVTGELQSLCEPSTTRRSDRSSSAATAPTSGSMAFRLILVTRSIARTRSRVGW